MDVTFDLKSHKYYSYRKDNNQLLYINKQSNDPPTITKPILSMVSRRISNISCSKEYFDKAASAYNNELKITGFNENIELTSTPTPRRNRNRKVIWFNPPYNANVKILVEYFYDSLRSTSHNILNTANYSIETILRLATVVHQIWQVSSETITPVY